MNESMCVYLQVNSMKLSKENIIEIQLISKYR